MQAGFRVVAALSAVVALSGCSRAVDEGAPAPVETALDTAAVTPQAVPPTPAPEAVAPDAGATVGGDGSEIRLSVLTAADIEGGKLAGELGCSFSTEAASPLLVAMGNVASKDRAFGLVKVGDYVEPVSAPGGFDGMLKGATFAGKGKTVRIAVTGPASGGGESPARPATLTYDRADGAKRVFTGRWVCGP